MAIKKYTAVKDNVISTALKANLSSSAKASNMGSSDILDIFSKNFYGLFLAYFIYNLRLTN